LPPETEVVAATQAVEVAEAYVSMWTLSEVSAKSEPMGRKAKGESISEVVEEAEVESRFTIKSYRDSILQRSALSADWERAVCRTVLLERFTYKDRRENPASWSWTIITYLQLLRPSFRLPADSYP
jgi:hypothetical protein